MLTSALIAKDLSAAMKARDSLRVSVLRLILTAIHNQEIAVRRELRPEEIVKILAKEISKREEAIVLYEQGKRPELADKERQEIQLIKAYLPQMMNAEKVKKIIIELKKDNQLGSNFGQAMRTVMAKLKGKADGKLIAQTVKEFL
jgi:uncharacterized protein YqeY